MRKFLLLALLFVSPAMGQFVGPGFNRGALLPGWTFLQDLSNFGCSTGTSACGVISHPTTANSVWIIFVSTGSNTTISSVTGSSGTWNTCPASACHAFNTGNGGVDAVYNLTGSGGGTSHTVHLSGSATGFFYAEFIELAPPAGFTASLDVSGATTNTSCSTSCNGVPLTLTSTDAVVQITNAPDLISPAGPFTWSSPYLADGASSGLALNVSSIAGTPTFGLDPCSPGGSGCGGGGRGSSWLGISALAFKSTAGNFQTASLFTWKNFATSYVLTNGTLGNCNLGAGAQCPAFTIPSTTAGNLLFIQEDSGNGQTLSSISDGSSTYVIPSGASTCRITNATGALSCGYTLSVAGGITSLTFVLSGTTTGANVAVYEIARTTGTWALDAQGSTANATSTIVTGQSLNAGCAGCSNAITGTNDVVFIAAEQSGGPNGFTLYPYPFINKGQNQFGGGWTFDINYANTGMLLNTGSAAASRSEGPSNPSNVSAIAFK